MDFGDVHDDDDDDVFDLSPCAANAVRHISSGYVASVAQTPAVAPDTKATVVGAMVVVDEKK
jgi:hypothetical protein